MEDSERTTNGRLWLTARVRERPLAQMRNAQIRSLHMRPLWSNPTDRFGASGRVTGWRNYRSMQFGSERQVTVALRLDWERLANGG